MKINLWTDGGCSNNQEKRNYGGWGFVAVNNEEKILIQNHLGAIDTTNNQMELSACAEGLQALEMIVGDNDEIEIFTDSAYLCNCMNQRWYESWLRNGWKNSKKQPVANKELWVRILHSLERLKGDGFVERKIKFTKVKGHSGVKWNEYVDGLANQGIQEAQSIPRTL